MLQNSFLLNIIFNSLLTTALDLYLRMTPLPLTGLKVGVARAFFTEYGP